jgi:hypothetical protein
MLRPFGKRDHGEDRGTRGQQGKHILLEKPMATKIDECAAINSEVKKNLGVHFYTENLKKRYTFNLQMTLKKKA